MIMVHGKLRHRRTWKAGAVTACAAALLSLGLLPAAAQAGTRAAASQRAEGVRVIGHKVIDGKTYKVIYVAGASPARTKPKVTQAAVPSTIVNDHSGKCAEVYHSQTSNGANVDQWSCNGTATQTWNFELVGVDTYGNPVGLIKNASRFTTGERETGRMSTSGRARRRIIQISCGISMARSWWPSVPPTTGTS
jgi:hypothetical protein